MKNLLVISNHNPQNWDEEQRRGWSTIEFIQFPPVPADASFEDVVNLSLPLIQKIREWVQKYPEGKVCVQGEYTLCYIIYKAINDNVFVFPTTERVTKEEVVDGKTMKTSVFKFVRWR